MIKVHFHGHVSQQDFNQAGDYFTDILKPISVLLSHITDDFHLLHDFVLEQLCVASYLYDSTIVGSQKLLNVV
jgi:hypothetical protein